MIRSIQLVFNVVNGIGDSTMIYDCCVLVVGRRRHRDSFALFRIAASEIFYSNAHMLQKKASYLLSEDMNTIVL